MAVFPIEVLEHHRNNAVPVYSTLRATIKKGTKPKTGLTFENRDNFNSRNIIGFRIRVNPDSSGKAISKEGNLLITREWAEQIFLEFKIGSQTVFDQIALSSLIPTSNEPYIKVFFPVFQPSVSKFTFPVDLLDAVADRDIVLELIHSDL
jgi:hypothetical protein